VTSITPGSFAQQVVRKLFASRGNHSEMHLSEGELAVLIEASIDKFNSLNNQDELPLECVLHSERRPLTVGNLRALLADKERDMQIAIGSRDGWHQPKTVEIQPMQLNGDTPHVNYMPDVPKEEDEPADIPMLTIV
jgi:hypothetical protein